MQLQSNEDIVFLRMFGRCLQIHLYYPPFRLFLHLGLSRVISQRLGHGNILLLVVAF